MEGRKVGLIVAPDTPAGAVLQAREAVLAAGMMPLVTAPRGGRIGDVAIDRTLLTAASVEFDSLLVLGAPQPEELPSFDAKAGFEPGATPVDPRVTKIVGEMFRHCKAIAVVPDCATVREAASVPAKAPGVIVAEPQEALADLSGLLAEHRVWERFPVSR